MAIVLILLNISLITGEIYDSNIEFVELKDYSQIALGPRTIIKEMTIYPRFSSADVENGYIIDFSKADFKGSIVELESLGQNVYYCTSFDADKGSCESNWKKLINIDVGKGYDFISSFNEVAIIEVVDKGVKRIKPELGLRDKEGIYTNKELNIINKWNKSNFNSSSIIPGYYDAELIVEDGPLQAIKFNGLKIDRNIDVGIEDVPEEGEFADYAEVYAIDPTQLDFENATVTAVAKGDELWKCKDWNFTEQKCFGEWAKVMDIVPGQEYTFELTPDDPGFAEIIVITKAEHLDENKTYISNIYEQVRELDDVWSETIPAGHYVKITFEKNLTSSNDITLYPRTVSGTPRIEIYEKDGTELIAEFTSLNDDEYNKVYLTGLVGQQDTFDLRILDGSVEFDHIIDPVPESNNYAESTGQSTTTSMSYQDKTTLTFTPDDSSTYLIISSWLVQESSTSYSIYSKLARTTGSAKDFNEIIYRPKDAIDYLAAGAIGIDTFGPSPGSQTYKIQYMSSNSSGTARIKEAKIFAIKLTSDDYYNESESRDTTTSTTYQNKTILTFTPPTEGEYILLVSATSDGSSRSYDFRTQLYIDGATSDIRNTEPAYATNRYPWIIMKKVNLTAASHTIIIQYSSENTGATAGIAHARIVALRADKFNKVYYAEEDARTTTASTSYQNKTTLTQTPNAVEHIIIGTAGIDGASTSYSSYAQLVKDGTTHGEMLSKTKDATSRGLSYFSIKKENLTAVSTNWNIQYMAESASYSAGIADARIAVIELTSPAVSNSPPTHTTPILNSTDGSNDINQNLTVYNQSTSDADGDSVKNIINWNRNSSQIAVLNMPFEGGSNSTWTRDYALGNNGTVSGATWNSTGGYDGKGAYEFDGSSSYISIGDSAGLNFTGYDNFTISVWINPSNIGGYRAIFGKGDTQYHLQILSGGIIEFCTYDASWRCATSDSEISLNTWHHIVARRQGSEAALFVNGVKQATTGNIGQIQPTEYDILIGENSQAVGRYFNGTIDELMIFNRSLSAEQIKALYENRTDMIVSNETSVGDVWQACITPNDGKEDGTELCSNSLTILEVSTANSPPTHTTPILNSTDGSNYTNQNLTVYNQSTSDANGDSVKNIINWNRNSSQIAVLNMPFEGGSNSTWTRDYALGNNGAVSGATWNSTGGYDGKGAYEFDGINDNITVPFIHGTSELQNRTFLAWVNKKGGSGGDIFVVGDITVQNRIVILDGFDRYQCGGMYDQAGLWTGWGLINNDEWTFVACSYEYNGTDAIHRQYRNGNLETIQNLANVSSYDQYSDATKIYVGSAPSSNYFNGTIDDVMVFNRTLSNEQIMAIYLNKTDMIVSNETSVGDVWQACVTPNDGTVDGTELCSNNLTIPAYNTPPSVIIYYPEQNTIRNRNDYISIMTNISDPDGINNSRAEITLPNSTTVNISLHQSPQKDNFNFNTLGIIWKIENDSVSINQTCIADIDTTVTGKAFTSISGNGAPNFTDSYCSLVMTEQAIDDFDINISFNITHEEGADYAMLLKLTEIQSSLNATKNIFISIGNWTGYGRTYDVFVNDGVISEYISERETEDTYGKFRIKRANNTFTFYTWNNPDSSWSEEAQTEIDVYPGLFITLEAETAEIGWGSINVTWDDLETGISPLLYVGSFKDTFLEGDYNITIIAQDNLGGINNSEKTNFTIMEINDAPTTPFILSPYPGLISTGVEIILWSNVYDEDGDSLRFNITLLNPDLTFNSTIISNYGTSSSTSYEWDTSLYPDGAYSLKVTVFENETSEGLSSYSIIDGEFKIDNTAPQISFVYPTPDNGSHVSAEIVIINISATEPNLDHISIHNMTSEVAYCESSPCIYLWNTSEYPSGSHIFYAYAEDQTGKTNTTENRTFIINNIPTHTTPILNSTDRSNDTNQNLTAYNQSTSDADGDYVKNIINWYKNSSSIAVLNIPFEGGSNSTWTKDYSGYGNNGTVSGAAWNSTGGYDGKGVYIFDGEDDYIYEIPNSTINRNKGTIEVWAKPSSFNSPQHIIWAGDPAGNGYGPHQEFHLSTGHFLSDLSLYGFVFFYGDGEDDSATITGGTNRTYLFSGNLTANEWYHVVVTWDFDDMTSKMYINGDLVDSDDLSGDELPYDTSAWQDDLYIGRPGASQRYFNGTLDEVRIYDAALSPEQIEVLYANRTDVIVSQETEIGDVWQACVTPNDGYSDGAELCSNSLIISEISEIPEEDEQQIMIEWIEPDNEIIFRRENNVMTNEEQNEEITWLDKIIDNIWTVLT